MCGIAGVIAWSDEDRFRVRRETLAGLSACIAHRGPDGQGIYLNTEVEPAPQRIQVGLVHRRLAILDPDPRSDQPFTDGRRWIVFNGEIYNFRELRPQLQSLLPDYQWRTASDTEVLLAAYAAWGDRCLDRLNGMFAFAIYTPPSANADAELFLARDRMGQKPLYISHDPHGGFAFASELRALRELPWVDRQTNPAGLVEYLSWGYIARDTIYRGIGKLPPATWMRVSASGEVDSHRYFDANDPPSSGRSTHLSLDKATSRTRFLLRQAVRRQLVSDVPLGCFLSGGIDSSIVAAAMCDAVPADQEVLTFSIKFDDHRYDESRYAAAVARYLGTQHCQFTVKPNAAEDLPKLAATFGEPFADSSALPTHYLSRETRQFVKVALSGDGGDELFGGYDRYKAMDLGQRAGAIPSPLLRLSRPILRLPGSHPKSPAVRLKRFVATLDLPPAERYASYLRIFDDVTLRELLKPDLVDHIDAANRVAPQRYDELFGPPLGSRYLFRDVVQAALAVDRDLYLPEDLLVKVDRASMLHALEVRSPFMDHELVHFASALPTRHLIAVAGKRLLREAFREDLPEAVFKRRKMGFALPIGKWLRGPLRAMLSALLLSTDSFATTHFHLPALHRLMTEHQSNASDHSQRLYALMMLELWWRSR